MGAGIPIAAATAAAAATRATVAAATHTGTRPTSGASSRTIAIGLIVASRNYLMQARRIDVTPARTLPGLQALVVAGRGFREERAHRVTGVRGREPVDQPADPQRA